MQPYFGGYPDTGIGLFGLQVRGLAKSLGKLYFKIFIDTGRIMTNIFTITTTHARFPPAPN
jgi:hypothetical protein